MTKKTTPPIPMPVEIDDVTLAFPASALEFMPAWEDIPEDFRNGTNPWCDFQKCWFAVGLGDRFSFQPKEGIDPEKVYRQLTAIQKSFAPKHQHKVAAVGYLASLWMESLVYGPPDIADEKLSVLGDAPLELWLDYFAKVDADIEEDA